MTFSIVARCPRTGQFGAAISSSSPAVASRCIRARAGIGVVATQNITDPELANVLLDLIKYDLTPEQALSELNNNYDFLEYRQLALINAEDPPAAFSGQHSLGIFNTSNGEDALCLGNLLANKEVTNKMLQAFETSEGDLADRLMITIKAGVDAGGEASSEHSAGLLVVDKATYPIIDLRVDWAESNPIEHLYDLWNIYKPQVQNYVKRAVNPNLAPSYGVLGDL